MINCNDDKILVVFDRELIGDELSDNIGAFTVTGVESEYIGGPTFDVNYPVIDIIRPHMLIQGDMINLTNGECNNIIQSKRKLKLDLQGVACVSILTGVFTNLIYKNSVLTLKGVEV